METPPLSADHTESLETMAPREERGSLKRKSDEDLGNDPKRRPGTVQEDSSVVEQDRKVIIMKGSLPKLALPEGWIALNHRSGGIVYLHKPTRVCTWSRPYHIGGGSVRKHDIPLAAIPCLHQKRGLAAEQAEAESANAEKNSLHSNKGASILNALNMSETNTDEGAPVEGVNTENGHERNGMNVIMSLADAVSTTENSGVTECYGVTVADDVQAMNGEMETDDVTEKDGMTKRDNVIDLNNVMQHSQAAEDCIHSKDQDVSGKETSLNPEKPVGETNPPPLDLIDAKELGIYLSSIWEFESLTSDQEKNAVVFQPQVLDDLELPASLECHPLALKGPENSKQPGRDLLFNAGGKTPVAILHEYSQRVLKTKPIYLASECESADTPFMTEVQIDGIKYGSGTGSNKKVAKQTAAEATLEVLLPGVFKKVRDYQISEAELEFFDKVDIVDPRLPEFCSKTTLPNPAQILEECLKRNQGICSSPIQFTTVCGQDRNLSFKITCGKHEATGPCKNKRLGKQLASQQILKKLHPHLQKWGALIRIYCDRPTGSIKKYKKDDKEYISEREVRSGSAQQNHSLLERLKEEMRRLHVETKKGRRDDRYSSSKPVFTVDF